MNFDTLENLGLERGVVETWRTWMGENLLPVQEKAVLGGILSGKSLVISAPAGSGKTFAGEMAAFKAAREGKRAAYLVPLRSIAEEKHREFTAKYAPLGISVAVSTRDHREDDPKIVRKRADLIVATYEKFDAIVASAPKILADIGLVVVDELQMIADPGRGGGLETLLTRILMADHPPQLIGLSAVLGNPDVVANWLGAGLIVEESRPVELRVGVLCGGEFRYRGHNSQKEGKEKFLDLNFGDDPDPEESRAKELTFLAIEELAATRKEQVLVFMPTKPACMEWATEFARQTALGQAEDAIAGLAGLEESMAAEQLRETLSSSVAFHHADLTMEYRELIERGVRDGQVRVVFSTPTLAMGVNLPFDSVFVWPEKVTHDPAFGWAPCDLAKSDFDNMVGRAARPGNRRPFGRGIIVKSSPFHARAFYDKYVSAPLPPIEPAGGGDILDRHLLRMFHEKKPVCPEDVTRFLLRTFTGDRIWSREGDPFVQRASEALKRFKKTGLIEERTEGIVLTCLGEATAKAGILPETAARLRPFIENQKNCAPDDVATLLAVAGTADAVSVYVRYSDAERTRGILTRHLREILQDDEDFDGNGPISREEARGIRKVLILHEWINERPLITIEEQFGLGGGSVQRIADEFAWLVDALRRLLPEVTEGGEFAGQLETLSQRLRGGVHEELLPLLPLKHRGFGREKLRALFAGGFLTADEALSAPKDDLLGILGSSAATRMLEKPAPRTVVAPPRRKFRRKRRRNVRLLFSGKEIADGKTGILLDGELKPLPERDFEIALLLALGSRRGEGWVPASATDPNPETARRIINRVREKLAGWLELPVDEVIQNNLRKSYRLRLPPGWLRIEKVSLRKAFPEIVEDVETTLKNLK